MEAVIWEDGFTSIPATVIDRTGYLLKDYISVLSGDEFQQMLTKTDNK